MVNFVWGTSHRRGEPSARLLGLRGSPQNGFGDQLARLIPVQAARRIQLSLHGVGEI